MLFNSYVFIFLFLPAAAIGFFASARHLGERAAMLWLIGVSVFFYGYWDVTYVPLLGVVMVFTYLVGKQLAQRPDRRLLAFGVTVLLAVLGYYKYSGFLAANLGAATGEDYNWQAVVLPLAISFFTFQKIAFLVDSHRGLTKDVRFLEYTLFVAFFPQLIAGPIVHWKELVPQFRLPETYRPHAENIAVGLTIFAIGLFKKAVLADGIAVHATPVFDLAARGGTPDLLTAWGAALAYTFQLYFDFSGYSDMAIGAARLFGVKLPLNFHSPYKAENIIDFWRRWHMTLSRFLRDYLYFALGGNRRGPARRYVNLFLTMLLGGLWHGAGWQFVLWGALHGAYLMVNHAWRAVAPAALLRAGWWRVAAWALTFVAVVIAWVPFRAANLDAAGRILGGMAGMHGLVLPGAFEGPLGALTAFGFEFRGGASAFLLAWGWIAALFLIARFFPNTQEVMAAHEPAWDADEVRRPRRLLWRPERRWALVTASLLAAGVLALSQVSEFLYFQF